MKSKSIQKPVDANIQITYLDQNPKQEWTRSKRVPAQKKTTLPTALKEVMYKTDFLKFIRFINGNVLWYTISKIYGYTFVKQKRFRFSQFLCIRILNSLQECEIARPS